MKIVVAESKDFSRDALAILEQLGEVMPTDPERGDLATLLPDAEVLFVRLRHRIDDAMLAGAPRLRTIVSPTTGLDHIDREAAARRGVAILSLQGEEQFLRGITATAELTWALILELARRISAARADVVAGAWNRDTFKGRQLKGKTIGIVGFGRLGRIVADYGHAFRMVVLAHDPNLEDMPEWVSAVSFDKLLEAADIVSLHVPLAPATERLVGAQELGRMKPGAWLINTSRGELIDEPALLASLEAGRLAAAALDVLAGEAGGDPFWLDKSPLVEYARSHDNLVITPHIGGATVESMAETELFMAEKLRRFLVAEQDSPDGRRRSFKREAG